MKTSNQRDVVTWIGLAIVGLTAAVLSFSALMDLARLCGIRLPWLFPLTIDVFAAIATRIWLRASVNRRAVRYASWCAWLAIGATVSGNAYHGSLIESGRPAPLVAVVIVSALPAVALGALVHLAVLCGRPQVEAEPEPAPADAASLFLPERELFVDAHYNPRLVGDETGPRRAADYLPRPVDQRAPDHLLLSDLRDWTKEAGARPTRDVLRTAYGIGSSRAERLLAEVSE